MADITLDELRQAVDAVRRDMQAQIDTLKAEIAALKAAAAEQPEPEVAPETLAILAATITACLGKKVRIRSARPVSGRDAPSPWAQQSRVFVQAASHDLRHAR
jgi:hypothetical protein